MKYFKIILCVLLICALFTGCDFKMSSSIDDLISPLSPFGDNSEIKTALDDYAKNGYSLKIPNSGKYIESYALFDVDGDGKKEAFAFYEPSDKLGTVNMAVIKNSGGSWSVVQNIKGEGREVHSIDFEDIGGDGKSELLVCWDAISNSSNHILTVYKPQDKKKGKIAKIGDSITVNNYIAADMIGDEVKELLLFKVSTGNSASAKAELYSLEGNSLVKNGETKLDSHISSYNSTVSETVDGKERVYADALSSDGGSMLTEVIYWSDTYDTIVSPFYSYSTGLTTGTSRTAKIPCLDINSDKLIEVPTDYSLPSLPKGVNALDWKVYKNTILIHSAYSLFVEKDMYTIRIDDGVIGRISVSYDSGAHELSVKNKKTGGEVFSLRPVLKATYKAEDYPGYKSVMTASGYYYLAKTGNDSEIKITADELKSGIKSVNPNQEEAI